MPFKESYTSVTNPLIMRLWKEVQFSMIKFQSHFYLYQYTNNKVIKTDNFWEYKCLFIMLTILYAISYFIQNGALSLLCMKSTNRII